MEWKIWADPFDPLEDLQPGAGLKNQKTVNLIIGGVKCYRI